VSTDALDDMGPVDIVVIGFPPGAPMTGESVPIMLDLVDKGIVRILDALLIFKEADGTFSGLAAQDLSQDQIGDFTAFAGANSGLIGDEDLAAAAAEMEPGSAAAILVYENRWAAPFAAAVRRNGGRLIATERIPVQDLIAALDAVDPAS
jgi:hypothetical protein